MKILILLMILSVLPACAKDNDRVIPSSTTSDRAAVPGDNDDGSIDSGSESNPEGLPIDDNTQVNVNYIDVVAPLIQDACLGCHVEGGSASQAPLDSREILVARLGSELDPSINSFLGRIDDDQDPMPPGAPRATRDGIIKLLQDWQRSKFK